MRADTFKFQKNQIERPTIAQVKDVVMSHFGLSNLDPVYGAWNKSSSNELRSKARRIAFYLCRQFCDVTYSTLCKEFGVKHHKIIIQGIHWCEKNMHQVEPLRSKFKDPVVREVKKECSICKPSGKLCLCPSCFSAWPKGVMLEEYIAA